MKAATVFLILYGVLILAAFVVEVQLLTDLATQRDISRDINTDLIEIDRRLRYLETSASVIDGALLAGTGKASYYGDEFEGRLMASALPYYHQSVYVAHKTLPMGSLVALRRGQLEVLGVVMDRGPFTPGRSWDLSKALAERLNMLGPGVVEVEFVALPVEVKHGKR